MIKTINNIVRNEHRAGRKSSGRKGDLPTLCICSGVHRNTAALHVFVFMLINNIKRFQTMSNHFEPFRTTSNPFEPLRTSLNDINHIPVCRREVFNPAFVPGLPPSPSCIPILAASGARWGPPAHQQLSICPTDGPGKVWRTCL